MRAIAIVATALAAGIASTFALAKLATKRKRLGQSDIDPFEETVDPLAPARDEPDYEGGCLVLGRKHYRFGDPYRLCLTANQERELFANKRGSKRKLGCGVFACAYEAPQSKRVIKFTRDSEDVAALLKAQRSGVVPKVFAVYKLKQPGHTIPERDPITGRIEPSREVPVYALSIERLKTIPDDERELIDNEIIDIRDVAEGKVSGGDWCDRQSDEDGNVGCSDVQMKVVSAVEKLGKMGIKWSDIHSGNIGYDARGKLKVLDLGLTSTQLKRRLKILEGLARARKSPSIAGLRLI